MKLLFIIPLEILVVILPFFFTGLGYVLNRVFTRGKLKAETEGIVVSQMTILIKEFREEINDLRKQNEKCELEHSITRQELEEVKTSIGYEPKLKGRVFILDDDYDVLHDFKKEFKKLSVIDYKGFHNSMEFLQAARLEKPTMVVMDHRLGGSETAETLIDQLGYEPEVIIMSGEPGFAKRYEAKNVKFYVKEGHYVFQIAGEVIKYLSSKK
jgi:hypothetical protein